MVIESMLALELGLLVYAGVQGSATQDANIYLKDLLGRTSLQEFKKLYVGGCQRTLRFRFYHTPAAFDPQALEEFLHAEGSSAEIQQAKQRILAVRGRYWKALIGLAVVPMLIMVYGLLNVML